MEHYYSQKPITKSNQKMIDFIFLNHRFKFVTDSSVFAKSKVDTGTQILLSAFPFSKKYQTILDFGCGYGVIGIVLAFFLKSKIDMIDINERALGLAMENQKLNSVKTNIFISDMYQNINLKYDLIITNPPIRIGKKKVLEILNVAFDYLKKDGELWFVIHKNHGARSYEKELAKNYRIEIVKKDKGFYVFRAIFN